MKLNEYRTPLGSYIATPENVTQRDDGAMELRAPLFAIIPQNRIAPINAERVIIPQLIMQSTVVIEGLELTQQQPQQPSICQTGCVKSEILDKVKDDKRTTA